MSLFGTLERSKSSPTARQIGSRSLFAFLCPALCSPNLPVSSQRRRVHQSRHISPQRLSSPSAQNMDNFFVTALVRASTCQGHSNSTSLISRALPLPTTHHKVRRKGGNITSHRSIHLDRTRQGQEEDEPEEDGPSSGLSQQDLISIVDIYGEWAKTPPSDSKDEPPDVKSEIDKDYFTQSEIESLADSLAGDIPPKHEPEEIDHIQQLETFLSDEYTHPDRIYEVYQKLPPPRAPHIPRKILNKICYHIYNVERKTPKIMMQYLSILDDMKASSLCITRPEWNAAIYLAGHSKGNPKPPGLGAAFSMWKEMENEAGIMGDHYTFSILFDIAVKCGKFALAEMLDKERIRRGIPQGRLSRMNRIFYYGLRRDGIGVRKAYTELVTSGEIIDTAVLTNVITSLISSGEYPAAVETFLRMKDMHAQKTGATAAPHSWRDVKQLRKILTHAAEKYRDNEEKRRVFQDAAPIAPNWTTYMVFIRHHAREAGNFDKVMELLLEMDTSGVFPTIPIFYWLFYGFQKHGGVLYSSWRGPKLEVVWKVFLTAQEADPENIIIDHGICEAVVKAFLKCVSRLRAQEVWAELRKRMPEGVEPKTFHLIQRVLDDGRVGRAGVWEPDRVSYATRRERGRGGDVERGLDEELLARHYSTDWTGNRKVEDEGDEESKGSVDTYGGAQQVQRGKVKG
ncbi:hypothetical protein EJ08DRAFT_633489 [Tothia fuscella]|uniref:Pentatricopeptide repeat protein n=1 Tax=Tothia fuscella TaxID=1048955 RepID=A0A9P4TYW1_9PEZI|nr:hypothetical protein EJ08DRAFT_633489 [Tothia fuscella]